MHHGQSMWTDMIPLILVAGSALVGLATVNPRSPGDPDLRYRWPVTGLLFTTSMAHVPLIPDHLEEAPYMGVLFLAFSVAAFANAALLAWGPSPVLYAAAGVLCSAALVCYAATRLIAFPQLADDVGQWLEPLGIVSVLAEAGVVALVVGRRRDQSGSRPAPHPSI